MARSTESSPLLEQSPSLTGAAADSRESSSKVRMYVIYSNVYISYTLYDTVEPLSNPDTNGAEESVIVSVSEVSSFQRLNCMQEWYILGVGKGSVFFLFFFL